MDIKQQTTTARGGPDTNPMNLTCKPASGTVPEEITAEIDDGTEKYALVMNGTGSASAPNQTWSTVFVSTEDYTIKSADGTIDFTIPAGGLGIYSK